MKRILFLTAVVSFVMGTTVFTGFAASEHDAHHLADAQANAPEASKEMMMQHGLEMGQMPCMAPPPPGDMMPMMGMMGGGMSDMKHAGMHDMMGAGKMDMMGHQMEHTFFLDRAEKLGLSAEQISQLKKLHMECRKDNIRTAAEVKIARMELADLLSTDNWSIKDAEALVRKVQKLEGDIQVRHLQGISDARKVLTAEQLEKAQDNESLESLFK